MSRRGFLKRIGAAVAVAPLVAVAPSAPQRMADTANTRYQVGSTNRLTVAPGNAAGDVLTGNLSVTGAATFGPGVGFYGGSAARTPLGDLVERMTSMGLVAPVKRA